MYYHPVVSWGRLQHWMNICWYRSFKALLSFRSKGQNYLHMAHNPWGWMIYHIYHIVYIDSSRDGCGRYEMVDQSERHKNPTATKRFEQGRIWWSTPCWLTSWEYPYSTRTLKILYPYTAKRRDVHWDIHLVVHPLRDQDFPQPSGFALGTSLRPREISWSSGMYNRMHPSSWQCTDTIQMVQLRPKAKWQSSEVVEILHFPF